MIISAEIDGRDKIEVEYASETVIGPPQRVSMVGCANFIEMMQKMKKNFGIDVKAWPIPQGSDHSSLLLKELILKLRGEWNFPYQHEELCHCRKVSCHSVDQAVLCGAHTAEMVSRQTSAGTACGTCRTDTEKIISYRLQTDPLSCGHPIISDK